MLAVRWYLRYGLSYRDVEELLVELGIEVDHVTIHRWVQRFTPPLFDAARTFFATSLAAHGEPDELGTESSHPHLRIASAFEELTETI
jgi:hypothetical protein